MWPVLRLQCKPTHIAALDATIDLVQAGNEVDTVRLVVHTRVPTSSAIVELLHAARLCICRVFGGRNVDFVLHAAPWGDGATRLSLAPIAALRKDKTIEGPAGCSNPLLDGGTTAEAFNLAEGCYAVGSSEGKGNMICPPEAKITALEGERLFRRLCDFNRIPGLRAILVAFLSERFATEFGDATPAEVQPPLTMCLCTEQPSVFALPVQDRLLPKLPLDA